jgi:hypothetical protein
MDPEIIQKLHQDSDSIEPDTLKNILSEVIFRCDMDEFAEIPNHIIIKYQQFFLDSVDIYERLPILNEVLFRLYLTNDLETFDRIEREIIERFLVKAIKNNKHSLFRNVADRYDFKFSHLISMLSENKWSDILEYIYKKDIIYGSAMVREDFRRQTSKNFNTNIEPDDGFEIIC